MTTPENGTLVAKGRSGRIYNVDIYMADAAGSLITLNPSGAAASTSPAYWRCPEDCVVIDVSVITGQTVSVGATFTANGATINGASVRWSNQLSTLNNRIPLTVPYRAGDLVGLTEY